MKKTYLLLLTIILFKNWATAQAYITQTGSGNSMQAATAIRLPFDQDKVEKGLKSYLSQKGYSPSNSHSYIIFRGVPLADGDKDGSDLYFTTSTPDRKVKDNVVLTLIPGRKNQDVGGGAFVDSAKLDQAKAFLEGLATYVTTFSVGVEVNERQEQLRKAQKKMDAMRSDSTDYENRIRDLQSDLAQNKADQVKASSDLQTYIGADSEKKYKYQKRVNNLIDKQSSLEKKIRNAQSDLMDKKADMAKQQQAINDLQHSIDATKTRQQ
jgi:hypothetical protein